MAENMGNVRFDFSKKDPAEYWQGVAYRVSKLHSPNSAETACKECWGTWPCRTQRILHGEE